MRDGEGGGSPRQGGERERARARARARADVHGTRPAGGGAPQAAAREGDASFVLPPPSILPPREDDNASATASISRARAGGAAVERTVAVAAEHGRAGDDAGGGPPSPLDWSQRYESCHQCGRARAVCPCLRGGSSAQSAHVNPQPNRHRPVAAEAAAAAAEARAAAAARGGAQGLGGDAAGGAGGQTEWMIPLHDRRQRRDPEQAARTRPGDVDRGRGAGVVEDRAADGGSGVAPAPPSGGRPANALRAGRASSSSAAAGADEGRGAEGSGGGGTRLLFRLRAPAGVEAGSGVAGVMGGGGAGVEGRGGEGGGNLLTDLVAQAQQTAQV